jgi:hypothetical protein
MAALLPTLIALLIAALPTEAQVLPPAVRAAAERITIAARIEQPIPETVPRYR